MALVLHALETSHGNLFFPESHRAGDRRLQACVDFADSGSFDDSSHVVSLDSGPRHYADAAVRRLHDAFQGFNAFRGGLFASRGQYVLSSQVSTIGNRLPYTARLP